MGITTIEQLRSLPSGFNEPESALTPKVSFVFPEELNKARNLWVDGKLDEAMSQLKTILKNASAAKDYNVAGWAAENLYSATSEWLIKHKNDKNISADAWKKEYDELPKLRQISWDNIEKPVVVDEKSHRVEPGAIGFSGSEPIGTSGIHQCLAVFLRNPETNKTAVAHYYSENSLESLTTAIEGLSPSKSKKPLEVRLLGAQVDGFPNKEGSRQNVEKVLGVLDRYGANILSADVLNQRAGQPTSGVVDPSDFKIKPIVPGIVHPNSDIELGVFTQPNRKMGVSFDLSQSAETNPVLLTKDQITQLRGEWQKSDLEMYADYRKSAPEDVLRNVGVRFSTRIHLIKKVENAYNEAISPIYEALDKEFAKRPEATEQLKEAARKSVSDLPLYLGKNAAAENQPIINFIGINLFQGEGKNLRINTEGLSQLSKSIEIFHNNDIKLPDRKTKMVVSDASHISNYAITGPIARTAQRNLFT